MSKSIYHKPTVKKNKLVVYMSRKKMTLDDFGLEQSESKDKLSLLAVRLS